MSVQLMAKTVNPLWIYGLGLFAISMLLVYIYTNYTDWKHYDKFVSSDTAGEGCGGLGNMLFRISSMHSIAKHLNRAACFQDSCAQEYRFELYSMIPKLQEFPLRTRCWNESGKSVRFAENAWNYESVSKLTDYENEKYVHLRTSGYLLSHRFFHHDRPEILSMFNFSAGISETVGAYAKQLFENNDSIKVCTHLRTGDFHDVSHPLLPTQEPFLMSAVKFLVEKISSKQSTPNVDVILFSSEFKYANEIKEKIKKLKYTNQVLIPRELNRVETLHLAARYCDYMLLSSAASTFGWWAAYLMPDQKQQNVYYNSVFFKPNHKEKAASFHEEDFFPPAWNRLVLNKEKKEVFVEDRRKPLINV